MSVSDATLRCAWNRGSFSQPFSPSDRNEKHRLVADISNRRIDVRIMDNWFNISAAVENIFGLDFRAS
jgi:hypothetical protein